MNDFYEKLDVLIPNPVCELEFTKDYELLISVMLSAQTTDKRVNSVTRILYKKYPTLESLRDAELEDIIKIIKPIGTYKRKAINVKEISFLLIRDCNGVVPNDREYLETLPGVGRKTTNVVLSILYNVPCIAVDTHVERVSKRLGFAKENDDVFDTTYEDVAKDAGIYVEEKTYKAIPIVVGGNHVLPAIEEAIEGLEAGDSKTIEIESENAFGKRNAGLIQLIPMKEFKKQGMTPVPGMQISSNGQTGKILTVNGGRVKVDFNHELAGKDLVYDVEVVEVIEDDEEKIKSMIELHYPSPNMDLDKTVIDIDGNVVNIQLDEIAKFDQKPYMDITFARFAIAKDIWSNMDFDKVNFVDAFEKKDIEADSEEDEE